MEQVSKITVLSKLNSDVKLLERELTNMANRLGALNQQVNDEQIKSKRLKDEYSTSKLKLNSREKQILQEVQDKRILASKINKIETENGKLRKILSKKNLTILESEPPTLKKRFSNNSVEIYEETAPRKDSLTDQINKNIENVFK